MGEVQIPAEGGEQWLKWSVWRVELGSMPRHGWLCHREGASAWLAAAQCVCVQLPADDLLLLLTCWDSSMCLHRSQEAEREEGERGWIHPKKQVLNKWMWQGERVEGWEEIGCLCIRFPHVWHIKRLHTHLHTLIYTQLYGFGRVQAVGQLWHGKGCSPICPLSW